MRLHGGGGEEEGVGKTTRWNEALFLERKSEKEETRQIYERARARAEEATRNEETNTKMLYMNEQKF